MADEDRRIVSSPTPDDDQRADHDGLTQRRDVFQLRRPLPFEESSSIHTRPFVVGSSDEANWITVNNRAFASHPDQSNMTPTRLHDEIASTWFDADGFRLHERDGVLAGFCWTKRHPASAEQPALGEIYVIGVDPAFQRLGLGRSLVIDGLQWLNHAGEQIAMLYVDESNTAARNLYAAMGFTLHHLDRIYHPPSDQPNQ